VEIDKAVDFTSRRRGWMLKLAAAKAQAR